MSLSCTLRGFAIAAVSVGFAGASFCAPAADAVSTYVGQLSRGAAGRSVVRWERKVCISVAGLPEASAQTMNDRIATAAVNAGLDTGAGGCKANVLIIVSNDPKVAATDALKANAELFSHNGQGRPASRDEVRTFTESSKPVRWWRYSRSLTVMGSNGGIGVAARGGSPQPFTSNGVMMVPLLVLIIVDAKSLKDASFPAVCDYVAMTALAEVNPDADVTAVPSILTLFTDRNAGRTPPAGLTVWDVRYLKALYRVQFGPTNDSQRERAAIADAMRQDQAKSAYGAASESPPKPQ